MVRNALLLAAVMIGPVFAATRHVPTEYGTIQAAILASVHHDTVLVDPGVYRENINFRGRNIVVGSRFIIDGDPARIVSTIIDGSTPTHPDTASCVLIVCGEDSTAVLEGFTLTRGTGTVWRDIHLNRSYREGGGVLIELSSPVIRHNLIIENEAVNTAGVTSAGGGGIRCGDASPLISHNVIARNRGRYGAGIVMNYATGTLLNNVICDNEGGEDYGGAGLWLYAVGPTVVEQNTIAGNHSVLDGGGIFVWSTTITGHNNIVWGNTAATGSAGIGVTGGTATLTFSDVQGGWPGPGNIDADPAFAAYNLYVTPSSPCVDAGDPASPPDPEDPSSPGMARYPAQGGLRADMGAYGGSLWPVLDSFTRPGIFVPVEELAFDYVAPGGLDTLEAAIAATGTGALVIDRVDLVGDAVGAITIDQAFPMTVSPFETASLRFIWAPMSDEPMFGAALLYHNDPAVSSPVEVALRIQQFSEVTVGQVVTDAHDSRSVNWVDADNDGALDLFITNGLGGGRNNRLYLNNGDGTFVPASGDPLVADGASSVGSSWADFDNDGDLDAFVVNWYGENNLLYVNDGGGSFTRITQGPAVTDDGFSETCGWADYDGDGLLDLFVANSGPGAPEVNFLYRNTGDGGFVRIMEGDIASDLLHSRSVSWGDYDGDGDSDLFVANEANENNSLYRNEADGTFTKITEGPVVTTHGKSFGSSWADFDNDGDMDLFVSNWGDQNNFLFRNDGGSFTRIMDGGIVNDHGYSIGSAWGDFDNDGDLDLYVTNGFSLNQSERLVDFLYANNGDGTFTRVLTGPIARREGWGYGAAWGDYDGDGDLDLCVARCFGHSETNALYRNTGTRNNWLVVRLEGTLANRSALGAKVRVKARIGGEDVWQLREISAQTGACGQNQMAAHFGLGDATAVDSLVLVWPRGGTDVLTSVQVNQYLSVVESGGASQGHPGGGVIRLGAYPNPFRTRTTISSSLPAQTVVKLRIVDLQGRTIRRLLDAQPVEPGPIRFAWDGTDDAGARLAAGVYLCRLDAPALHLTHAMTLLR